MNQVNRKRKFNDYGSFLNPEKASVVEPFSGDKKALAAESFRILNELRGESENPAFKSLINNVPLGNLLTVEERRDYDKFQAVYAEVKRAWMERVWTRWCENKTHVCKTALAPCKQRQLTEDRALAPIDRQRMEMEHRNCSTCLFNNSTTICDIDQFDVDVFDVDEITFHVCAPSLCNRDDMNLHRTLWKKIDWLHFCKQTGAMHVCDRFCNAEKVPDRAMHGMVCSITGLYRIGSGIVTIDQPAWSKISQSLDPANGGGSRSKKQSTGRSVEEILDACTESDFADTVIKQQRLHRQNGGKRRPGVTSSVSEMSYIPAMTIKTKEDALKEAISQLSITFSAQRFESFQTTRILVHSQLENRLIKCCSRALQNHLVPSSAELQLETDAFLKRNFIPPDMRAISEDRGLRRLLIRHYAQRCVVFWHVLCEYTNFREQGSFTFRDFIESALVVFEEGLYVSERDYSFPFTLYQKDALLVIISTSHSNLHRGNHFRLVPHRNRTPIKIYIKNALLETIRSSRLNPDMLRLENYNYNDLADHHFEPSMRRRFFPKKKVGN
jgi:hypothetical protein